jgi:tetratricopeptide (TPR) repeat protein
MEDNNGNWNTTTNNITVHDTITPPPPTLNNPPTGDISGDILFDWFDGSDPSGISYYILIIDNETDPLITPGYVYMFNITNSFYELTYDLSPGKYYYFLAQVDGAGHQSNYTMGTFTFNLNSNNNNLTMYIIVALILASMVGSVTVIVILRKKSQKKVSSLRKKVPHKLILRHIDKILSSELTLDEKELQNMLIQKEQNRFFNDGLLDKADLKINIDELKALGEELFKEGAYLEAIKQFQYAKEVLSKHGRNEDVKLFSDLIAGIEGLIEERERRLEFLEMEKIGGNSVKIFNLYYDIIEISEKIRDIDAVNMFKSELIQYFQMNKYKLEDIENHRSNLEHEADTLSNNHYFELAAQTYGKCEEISQLLVKLGKEEEIANVEKFKNKKMNTSKHFINT